MIRDIEEKEHSRQREHQIGRTMDMLEKQQDDSEIVEYSECGGETLER